MYIKHKSLKELIREMANFDFYRDGHLFYKTESGFRFSVPINDTGNGTFNKTERGITLMRWIRIQHDNITGNKDEIVEPINT